MKRATLLLLWGLTLLWSFHSGRLDLLLRGVFHGLVGVTGLFTVLMRPRAILITAIGASLGVLLIGQWINLWLL